MKILGCIQEIQFMGLIIDLPNSLHGYVPFSNIHSVLTEQIQKSLNQNRDEGDDEVIF